MPAPTTLDTLLRKKPLERKFYAEICRIERWRERTGSQLYLDKIPDMKLLRDQLHRSMQHACEQVTAPSALAPASAPDGEAK